MALFLVAAGTAAIAKGQRPANLWRVLVYPLPTFIFLSVILALMGGDSHPTLA
jgi:hypothetical protein